MCVRVLSPSWCHRSPAAPRLIAPCRWGAGSLPCRCKYLLIGAVLLAEGVASRLRTLVPKTPVAEEGLAYCVYAFEGNVMAREYNGCAPATKPQLTRISADLFLWRPYVESDIIGGLVVVLN